MILSPFWIGSREPPAKIQYGPFCMIHDGIPQVTLWKDSSTSRSNLWLK